MKVLVAFTYLRCYNTKKREDARGAVNRSVTVKKRADARAAKADRLPGVRPVEPP